MELIHNNYLKSFSSEENFKIEITAKCSTDKTYYEETKSTAELIWSQKLGKLYLLYSGGKDSELALYSFLSQGMNVTPVIISTKYNQHDIKYGLDFCNQQNIKPLIIDEDYDKFVASDDFNEVYRNMESSAYHYAMNCHWMTKLDGTVITGDSNPWLKKAEDNKWYASESLSTHMIGEYFTNKNIYGTPFFMCYTPKQYLAFMKEPTIIDLVNDRIPGKLGSETSKIHVYNNQNDFVMVPRQKFHGYEIVEKNEIFNHSNIMRLRDTGERYWRTCYIEYHSLVDALENGNKLTVVNNTVEPIYKSRQNEIRDI